MECAMIDNKHDRELQKIRDEHARESQLRQLKSQLGEISARARSLTIGTAFGGTSEIIMRRADGTVTYAIMQPNEVVEFIHQMAAGIGCCVTLQPRQDFSSWRTWDNTKDKQHCGQLPLTMETKQNEQPVAIEKTVKRRSTKRATKTA
jgi:hypothetical protein